MALLCVWVQSMQKRNSLQYTVLGLTSFNSLFCKKRHEAVNKKKAFALASIARYCFVETLHCDQRVLESLDGTLHSLITRRRVQSR